MYESRSPSLPRHGRSRESSFVMGRTPARIHTLARRRDPRDALQSLSRCRPPETRAEREMRALNTAFRKLPRAPRHLYTDSAAPILRGLASVIALGYYIT